ncbi:MAG: hypothetical protein Q9183_006197, partial [Haloplaca sp. 2 TL-2023]
GITPPPCPTSTADGWIVNGNAPLPSVGQTLDAVATASGAATTTGSASEPSASATEGVAAAGGPEWAGMGLVLFGVMMGFVIWL